MRENLPKIIGSIVLVAVIGGGIMTFKHGKNSDPMPSTLTSPAVMPVAGSALAPPATAVLVQESRRYKRDMLGYEDTGSAALPATAIAPPRPQSVPTVIDAGPLQGPPAPSVEAAQHAGRATLLTGKLAHQIRLESPQIKAGEKISLYYSCNQKNVSPPLSWSNAPSGTKSFVVMMEGPDKGRGHLLQWGVYNIPSSQNSLPEALPKVPVNDKGIGQAQNELGPVGYSGPCIPRGQFTFVFSVYALDTEVKLHGGASRNELINAMNGHVIDRAELPVLHYFRL
jgi:Raf kinase inhibitor-like YbhB/YbcL family protein